MDTSKERWETFGIVVPEGYWCSVFLIPYGDETWFDIDLYEDFENRTYVVGTFLIPVSKTALLNRKIQVACTKYRLSLPVYAYKYRPRKRKEK